MLRICGPITNVSHRHDEIEDLISRIVQLIRGNPFFEELVKGFNQFLPLGYHMVFTPAADSTMDAVLVSMPSGTYSERLWPPQLHFKDDERYSENLHALFTDRPELYSAFQDILSDLVVKRYAQSP